jgi:steroid 5-alpha reductase family enzyme
MEALLPVLPRTLAVLASAMAVLWLVSLRRRDASIVDPFWGTAFALAAWTAAVTSPGAGVRSALVLGLVTLWGLRLSVHLLRRNLGHGEDRRYAAMRAAHGARFPWVSLFTVFLFQAALAWAISLPVQAAVALPPSPLGALDALGVALFAAGFAFEAVGDAQLARFKADPASRGKVMDRGLWRYTRHPNYFGDALLWWGLGVLGWAAGAPVFLLSSALMTSFLVRVSGVALLEKDIGERRPGYADYVRRTSAFLPWFPRAAAPGPAPAANGGRP